MKKVAFIVSHIGSGSDYLVDILNNNPRCSIFNSKNKYEHPDSLHWLYKNHKLKNYSGAVYGDHLLFNHSFCCKPLYDYCKFIYVIKSPRNSLSEIYNNLKYYSKTSVVNYYRFRLRRICEMAKNTKGAMLITYDDLISGKSFGIIEKYLGLIQPLEHCRLEGEINHIQNDQQFSEKIINEVEDCYEKYYYYLNNLELTKS